MEQYGKTEEINEGQRNSSGEWEGVSNGEFGASFVEKRKLSTRGTRHVPTLYDCRFPSINSR